jgi:hypothetical protein
MALTAVLTSDVLRWRMQPDNKCGAFSSDWAPLWCNRGAGAGGSSMPEVFPRFGRATTLRGHR